MQSTRWILAAVLAAVMPMAAAAAAHAELKAGVVDIVEITNNYERTKDAGQDLKVEQDRLKQEAEPRARALQEIQVKRDAFVRGSKEYQDLDDKALKAEVELRNWLGVETMKIERRHRDVLLDMYHQISTVVARLAKEKGLDMVFTKTFLAPPQINVEEAQGLEDLKNRIMQQRILFPTDMADLTQDVLKILNAEYRSGKKPAAAPAAAPAPAKGKAKG